MDITYLKGVGPKKAELYKKIGVETVEQLTELYPRDYIDFTAPRPIAQVQPGEVCAFRAFVRRKISPFNEYARMAIYKAVLSDGTGNITAVFFNAKYTFSRLKENEEYLFYGKISGDLIGLQISAPLFVTPGEGGLMPKYPLTAGLSNNMVSVNMRTALGAVKPQENLPSEIIKRYSLCGRAEAIRKIHFPKGREEYVEARRRLVFEELLTLKLGLSLVRNRGKKLSGAVMQKKSMQDFFAALPFSPTGAQLRAIKDITSDMTRTYPMNRLLQGDVGSGKTLVAAAAAYFAYLNGYQTLVMAPTEVLARQHFATFEKLLSGFGVKVSLLSGSLTAKQKNEVRKAAADGEIDVLCGTQALIQKTSVMKNPGLAVVDEQHRFGVSQRSALAEKGLNPHILAMSATPIPRTLAMIVYGDLDVSVLDEMPKGRIPIKTYAVDTSFRPRIYNFIKKHIAAGKQAYIVCPLVEENESSRSEKASAIEYYNRLCENEFKDIPTGLLYGKMKQADKDRVMQEFRDNTLKLLVSTTVIEVGIDVPNAVVMLIENAEQFGLSQLHQLRGRVGRGAEQSYCILMTDNTGEYTKARTDAMVSTTDGFEIARRDLELRGPGNFFGREQSGLPPLKVADIADDAEVLCEVDSLAEEILRRDPHLRDKSSEGLRANVKELFSRNEEYGWN
ncbi:MAG: ATP-dependent DNA helicase RecG [Oscillospiraceae bacterium]|nr:ATP-dependent DNA helicase RecG [Oscillospiraceae bacterium]